MLWGLGKWVKAGSLGPLVKKLKRKKKRNHDGMKPTIRRSFRTLILGWTVLTYAHHCDNTQNMGAGEGQGTMRKKGNKKKREAG